MAVACLHQLAPEMVDSISEHDIVVFVDAHVSEAGWDPGMWQAVQPRLSFRHGVASSQADAVLALCHSLYGHCPRGYVLSIEGSDFDFGETLSPGTATLLDQAISHLLALLQAELITMHGRDRVS